MGGWSEKQNAWLAHDVLEEICETHGCRLWGKQIPNSETYLRFCPKCQREKSELENQERVAKTWHDYQRTLKHGALERESIISPELTEATLESFKTVTPAEKEGLAFAKKMARHYYEGGKGNVVFSGRPGQGKSHLALGMLRALNQAFDKPGKYRSAIFMPVARLFSLITDSFNSKGKMTESVAIELLTGCDFLVLDDLGKESTYSHELKRANDWKQSVLFQILDNRERTIITTNFTAEELRFIYDPALYSRILKGGEDLRIRFDETMIDKR